MKLAGIIAEYDPFHNGHAWQLAQAKALGAGRVAMAMSCGLTQRGALPLLPEPLSHTWMPQKEWLPGQKKMLHPPVSQMHRSAGS